MIVSIDGKPIKDGDQLVADISSRKVGSTVQLGYLRDGKQHTATVSIGDRNELESDISGPGSQNASPSSSDASESKLGISIDTVPAQLSSKLGIHGGVIVTSVHPGSFADDINITPGTVILEINRKPISDKADFNSIVNGLKSGQDVALKVRFSDGANTAAAGDSLVGGTLP